MSVTVTVFDGATSIGGSKIHVRDGRMGLFLDFGLNYSQWGRYYEEFLRPRTARGLTDLITLGIVPPFSSLYRDDLFPSDLSVDDGVQVEAEAILVSHAHLDHCGHIGLVRPDVEIYASGMTAVLMKAIQDSTRSDFDKEMVYFAPRRVDPGNSRMLRSSNWKEVSFEGRRVHVVDDGAVSSEVQGFWMRPPNPTGRGRKLAANALVPAMGRVGELNLRAYPVDHSILGATAFAIETSSGWVVYTGDFRLHGQRDMATEAFIEEVARLEPVALITEGTNVPAGRKTREEEVCDNCRREVIAAEGKLVVADFAARNLERLQAFLDIAKEANRRLAILAKDAYLLYAARLVDDTIPDLMADASLVIFEELKASVGAWEAKFIKDVYGHRYVTADDVERDQGGYILALSFWDVKHLPDIRPAEGSVYIYSTSEAYTEEQEIDAWRLWNWLSFLGMRPIGFFVPESTGRRSLPEPSFIPGYHSSGHISGDELIEVIRAISPRYLIPVHTEHPEFFVEQLGGEIEVVLPQQGEAITI